MSRRNNVVDSFYSPTVSSSGGSGNSTVTVINGSATIDDPTRNKTLSVDRIFAAFSINSKNISTIRKFRYSSVLSSLNTFQLTENYTLVGFTYSSANQSNGVIKIIKNGLTNILTIPLVSLTSKADQTVDIDLIQNDSVSASLEVTAGSINYPILSLEFARKY